MQVILAQQPALLDRAVKKLFSEEIAEAEESAAGRALAADKQEPGAWVLQSFWDRHSALGPSLAPKPAVAPAVTQGLSRYETDFQVRASSFSGRCFLYALHPSVVLTILTCTASKCAAASGESCTSPMAMASINRLCRVAY